MRAADIAARWAAPRGAPRSADGDTGNLAGVASTTVNGDPAGVGERSVCLDANSPVAPFDAMERGACIAQWIERFGKAPPRHVSVRLMRKALAYEAQVAAHGDHAPSVKKRLRDVLNAGRKRGGNGPGRKKPPAGALLKPGTHLVREWNGRTYQVAVEEDGFRMDGRHYRSLSAIARKITGAHWSGPRFFGVVRR